MVTRAVREARRRKRGDDVDALDRRFGRVKAQFLNFRFKNVVKITKGVRVKAEDRDDLAKHIKNRVQEEFKARENEIKKRMIKEDDTLRSALENTEFSLGDPETPDKSLKEILGKKALGLDIDFTSEWHFQDKRGKKTSEWKRTRHPSSKLNLAPSAKAPRAKKIRSTKGMKPL